MANKSQKYLLTINNPQEHGLDHEQIKLILASKENCTYWCMADEIGLETHTYHTHLFLYFRSEVKFTTIKKLFPSANIRSARGTCQHNRNYITKSGPKWENSAKSETSVEGTFEEYGEMPEELGQGYRSDIAEVYQMITEGMTNAEIMEANPENAAQISRMDKIRQDVLEAKYREKWRSLDVTYIFGPTETGKTRGVMEKHGYGNVYRITDYNHPFDRYAQEPVMCFDEFRSSLPIGDMLNYLDGYPFALPARYANRQACYETVYIISNIDLKQQYPNVQDNEPATWKAFLRRIHHVIEYHADKTTTDHGNATDYVFPPPAPVPDWVKEIDNAKQETIEELPF